MQVALSKIKQPKQKPQTLKRFRLLDLLHQNIHRKLTFLCASAGFGKTTLLVDFADDVDAKICWYQISATENTTPTFFIYFVHAFRQSFPDFGQNLINLVSDNAPPDPIALALAFSNEAQEKIQDFTVLILDDYHTVSQVPEIVTFLEKIVELVPDQIRIVIGSRNIYGIPSAELFIREELTTLSAPDLAFTESELIDLSNQYFHINLTEYESNQIIINTEGWIIAILLALRSKNLTTAIPKFAGAKDHIFEFLEDEILAKVEPELQKFMLVSSMFSEFQIDLCNHVLNIDHADQFVQSLIEQNLFISQIDTAQSVIYQYHQLFKEFLAEKFADTFSATDFKQFQLGAVDWYVEAGQVETGIELLIQAKEFDQALPLMNELALEIYISGRQSVLIDWYELVRELPELEKMAPYLILHTAKIYGSLGEADQVFAMFARVESELRNREDYENLVNLLVHKGVQYRFSGQYEEALACSDEAILLSKNFDLDTYYFQAERVKGLSFYFLGAVEKSIKHLTLAADGTRVLFQKEDSDRFSFDLVMILADIGYISIKNGDIHAAQKSYQEAYEISKTIRGQKGNIAVAANNQAYIQFLIGNHQLSWKYYEQALEAAVTSGWRRSAIDIYNGRGDLLRDLRLFEEAEKEYKRALAYKRGLETDDPFGETYLGLSEIERAQGNFNQSMYFLREAANWNQEDFDDPSYQIQQGFIYLSMEQLDLAQDVFSKVLNRIGTDEVSENRSKAYFLNSIITFIRGGQQTAIEQMKKSLKDAALLGHDQFLVVLAREFSETIDALKSDISIRHFEEICQKANLPTLSFDHLYKEPEKLVENERTVVAVTAFGNNGIRHNGNLISSKRWKSVGARALFFYILDFGRVTKTQISLDFWPDFSQGKVNSNFHATLWRVRNALGAKNIIQYDGEAYYLRPDVISFYDVDAFSRLFQKFNHELGSTERRNLGYQLIDLYGGHFLMDIDMSWADQRRAELRNKFFHILQNLAALEFSERHFEKAKLHYSRLLVEEPYFEDYHEGLLKAMIENGESAAAKRHYDEYERRLEKELSISPGERLENLSRTL